MPKLIWEVHEFEPSGGRRVGGTQVDHTAWLRRTDGLYISLNIGSVGVSAEAAEALLEAMCAGMNLEGVPAGMKWKQCDVCSGTEYAADNPFVEFRRPRPSKPSEMCCTLAGHKKCFNIEGDVGAHSDGGAATPEQWADWLTRNPSRQLG